MRSSTRTGILSDSDWLRCEEVIERFEVTWRETGIAMMADFLPPLERDGRKHLLEEMIKIDLEYRWRSGERPRVEDYVAQFPELVESASIPIELIATECRVRRFHRTGPSMEELTARFPDRINELLAMIGKPDDTSIATIAEEAQTPTPSTPGDRGSGGLTECHRLGRYELREQVGRGGFATVYRAWDPELQREVAIKVPRAEFTEDAASRARVLREARSAAQLRHPAIVPIHEVSEHGQVPFIVFEFISGPVLAELLRQTRPAPSQAAEWVARIAEALDYAHQCGIVHRDVKPANIMMVRRDRIPAIHSDKTRDESGHYEPMITDFGLALQTDSGATITREGDILGTPAYMSPEQARGFGHAADARTDVYGLGVLLYELLCGRPPFEGNPSSVLHKVIHEEPPSPHSLTPGIVLDLETICLKAMAKEPRRRFTSAGAMAADLRRFLAGEPIHARPISAWERTAKWAKRRPALAALVGVSSVSVLVLMIVILISNARLEQQRDFAEEKRQEAEVNSREAQSQQRRAVAHLKKAREAVDQMLTRVGQERLRDVPFLETVRRELLEDALRFYDDLAQLEGGDPELRFETARAYRRLGRINDQLGNIDEAERTFRQALELYEKLTVEFPNVSAHWQELAKDQNDLGGLQREIGRKQESLEFLGQALAVQERLVAEFPDVRDYQSDLTETYTTRGILFAITGRHREAEQDFRKAAELTSDLVARFPSELQYAQALAIHRSNLGELLDELGRTSEAEDLLRQSLDFWEQLAAREPTVRNNRSKLAVTLGTLATCLAKTGRPLEAEEALGRVVELRRELADEFPNYSHSRSQLGSALRELAVLIAQRGELHEARRLLELAIEHERVAIKLDPGRPAYVRFLRNQYVSLADTLVKLGEHAEAARTATELPPLFPDAWQDRLAAASVLARCASVAAKDSKLTDQERRETIEAYASRAVTLLREAIQLGFQDFESLKTNPDFAAVWTRDDFHRLLDGQAGQHIEKK